LKYSKKAEKEIGWGGELYGMRHRITFFSSRRIVGFHRQNTGYRIIAGVYGAGQKSVEPSVKLKHTRAELVFLLYSHSHVHGKRPFSVLSGRLGPSRPVGSPSI